MKLTRTKWLLLRTAAFFTICLPILFVQATQAEEPTNPPGTYTTSWLGNTFMDVNGYKVVTESLNDLCVSPGGTVFTAGYAEAYGGGASFNAADGSFAGRYSGTDSGFGDPLSVVAANDNYVYFGTGSKGLLRAAHGGTTGIYTRFLSDKNIQGLFIKDGKLYISDFGDGKIRILNISTMVEESSFDCAYPTRLTVDNAGNIWVVIYSTSSVQPPSDGPMWVGEKIKSFSATGTPGPEITDFEKPLSIALNNSGQLLVGGLNENSQIWIYDITGTPTKVGAFGEENGIFGGTVAGAFTSTAKLHWIRSIAVDADDNIYTGCAYGTFWGGVIEKWNSTGTLQWRNFAGTSLDCAGIDPDNETEVYSKFHHYSLDYSKTTPGAEWSLKGFTVDRFKYPTDPRVDQNSDVGSRSLGAGVYRIGGKLFVARSNQEGYRWELYRQETTTDGEVLVPSVNMAAGGDENNHFYNSTSKTWYSYPKIAGYNQYWSLAKNGDILSLYDGGYNTVIRYLYGGLDNYNNPIWRSDNVVTYNLSDDFGGSGEWCRRIVYDSDEDVLYAGGNNNYDNSISKLIRYDNLSTGKTKTWETTLPYNDTQYTPETGYGGGTPVSLSVAGDYVFVLYGYGHVRVLNKSDGSLVGTLVQDVANGWHGGGGQVDASYGMTVTKRLTGQYVILFENAGWANIMMQRWCPDGICSETLTPVEGIIVSPDTLNVYGTGTGTLSSEISPANASNKAINWISNDPTIATVKGAANGKCTVTGVKIGTCMVIATTKDGLKADTATVIVNRQAVTGLVVSPDSIVIGVNRTKQLTGTVTPENATNKNVIWESSDTTIVKVNSTGLITGMSLGSAKVRGISEDGNKTDSSSVTVGVTGDGLKGEYYNTTDFTGEIALTRVDPFIDFSYGDGSYAPGEPTDHFSVRWTGQVVPLYSETYTFETSCDDGSRLWVNGKQLVNNWVVQGETPKTGTITLTEGVKYNIKMEYYENDGGAAARLRWSSPSQAYEIIPQDQLYSSYAIIPVTGVSIAPDSVNLKIGANTTLVATFVPDNATNQEITWKSSDIAVANVDSKGRVKAISAGEAMITATTVEGSFTDSTKVVVEDAVAPLSPPLISLNFNEGTSTVAANTGSLPATFTLTDNVPSWSTNVPTSGGSNSVDFGTTTGDYVVESDAVIDGLKSLGAFTITGWVNCRNSNESGGGDRIVSWINGDGDDGVDLVYHSDGSLQMGINQWSDQGGVSSSAGKITTDPDANAGNWVFFAVTYDASAKQVSYYFGDNVNDAILDQTITSDMGPVGTDIQKLAIGHFNIATRSNYEGSMFRGLIDEVNIFGEVLTQEQIVKIQKPVVITPLISLNFNEGTGIVAANTGSLPATFSLSADVPIWSANVPTGGGSNSVDFGTTTGNYVVESDDVVDGLKSLDAFTITGWVNCRSSEEGGGGNRIVSWLNDGGDGVDLVYHTDGSFQIGINQWSDADGGACPRSSADKITTDPDANASNWVFFAVTYDSKLQDASYYFGNNTTNAVLDNSTTYDRGTVGTGISKLAIGHFDIATREWATDRMFRGLMDEIKIFGVALDAEQILKIQGEVFTGVSIPTSDKVILYPNPVKDILHLSVNSDRIIISDIQGREVLRTKGSSVDVSMLKQGVYIVKYFVGQKVNTSKIIKQ